MAKDESPKTEPRDYIVLRRTGPVECEIMGVASATSGSRAIDAKSNGAGGRWVAVPTRNWGEEELTVEQRDPIIRREKVEAIVHEPGPESAPAPSRSVEDDGA